MFRSFPVAQNIIHASIIGKNIYYMRAASLSAKYSCSIWMQSLCQPFQQFLCSSSLPRRVTCRLSRNKWIVSRISFLPALAKFLFRIFISCVSSLKCWNKQFKWSNLLLRSEIIFQNNTQIQWLVPLTSVIFICTTISSSTAYYELLLHVSMYSYDFELHIHRPISRTVCKSANLQLCKSAVCFLMVQLIDKSVYGYITYIYFDENLFDSRDTFPISFSGMQ